MKIIEKIKNITRGEKIISIRSGKKTYIRHKTIYNTNVEFHPDYSYNFVSITTNFGVHYINTMYLD